MKRPVEATCDCEVWRKALAPLMEATKQIVYMARATARVNGKHMKRVDATLIHDLLLARERALLMFPPLRDAMPPEDAK